MLNRPLFELLPFLITIKSGPDNEAQAGRAFQREHAASAGDGIQRQMCMLPVLKLAQTHIKRYATHFVQPDVRAAQIEFTLREAHRRAAVTAAA